MAAINFPCHVCIRYTFMDNSFCENFAHLYANVYWVSFYYERILLRLLLTNVKISHMKIIFTQAILHKEKKIYRTTIIRYNNHFWTSRLEIDVSSNWEYDSWFIAVVPRDNIADKGIAAKSKRSLAYSIPKSQTTREGDGLEDDPWSTPSRLQEKWRRVRAGEIGGAERAETRRKTCQFVGCWSYVSATT